MSNEEEAIVEDYLDEMEDPQGSNTRLRNRRMPAMSASSGPSSSSSSSGQSHHQNVNNSHLKDIQEEEEETSSASKLRRESGAGFFDGNNNDSPVRQRSVPLHPGNQSNGTSRSNPTAYSPTPKDEYINSLQAWTSLRVWKMYQEFLTASFMANTLMCANNTSSSSSSQFPSIANNNNPNRLFPLFASPVVQAGQPLVQGVVHKLPKIWKRIAAEGFDFLILLIIKLIATFIAIDYFELIDLSKIDLSLLEFNLMESSNSTGLEDDDFDAAFHEAYRLALELTSEIIVIESIHRVIVIVYETIFLMTNLFTTPRPGRASLTPGASTPGKYIMGLKVVSCVKVEDVRFPGANSIDDQFIRVTPSGDIGFWWSLLRSIIKNFSTVFFIPASLTMFVSKHNRAAYDIACRCIVIEDVSVPSEVGQ